MIPKQLPRVYALLLITTFLVAACQPVPQKVCVVLNNAVESDKGFNEFTLKGARDAARAAGLDFAHVASGSENDYESNIRRFVDEECHLIITVGFLMGEATARVARENPDVHFAIVDVAYLPGDGCDAELATCYSPEGGLANVTSLMFAEDEVGYLAGTLAACMSENGVISSVAGMEIPPVVRFVTGYQTGALDFDPDIVTFNTYIPDFNDPSAGKRAAEGFIRQGADIVFGVGGNTGNGGLLGAYEAGVMAIGVDVDQYETFPDVAPALLTSATKNMDVATRKAVEAFAAGELADGIQLSTVANGGIGLAPYHDFEDEIPAECRAAVETAAAGLQDGSLATGYTD